MNPSERTKEALLAKTEALCSSIYDLRKDDPWGGNGYLSTILRATKMQDTVPHPTAPNETIELPPSWDYATSAHKELVIKEQTAALINTSREIATLVRDLQELWLFGGLDTLADPADEEVNREKAHAVAEMVETLAKKTPAVDKQKGGAASKSKETNGA